MDQTILVAPDVEGGKELLKALDEATLDIRAALWLYMPETSKWRLIVASPLVDQLGPKETYRRIQSVLTGPGSLPNISLMDISVEGPDSKLIKLLRFLIHTSPDSTTPRAYAQNTTVNNVFFEAMVIYRMS